MERQGGVLLALGRTSEAEDAVSRAQEIQDKIFE
jgi:hypothetical protein